MTLVIGIAAVDSYNGLAKDGKIPFHSPNDMRHFKYLTHGGIVIVSRSTLDSIQNKLPNRTKYIVSKSRSYTSELGDTFTSVNDAINYAKLTDEPEVYVIGGSYVYNEVSKYDLFYLTRFNGNYHCDIRLDTARCLRNMRENTSAVKVFDDCVIHEFERLNV